MIGKFLQRAAKSADLSSQGRHGAVEASSPLPQGRGRRDAAGEAASPAPDCAIWNDIARALELKPGGAK